MRRSLLRFPAFFSVLASVASCGLFVSFDDYDASVDGSNRSSARFAVRGRVYGLAGGEAFAVTVDGGPSWRSCSVEDGTGAIQGADAAGAATHCVDHDTE